MLKFKSGLALLLCSSCAVAASVTFEPEADLTPERAEQSASAAPSLPAPYGWSVQANPSVENSLSYLHKGGDLAVSVTYIAGRSGEVSAEAYARVASEQMHCEVPIRSDLIKGAWAFHCKDRAVEGIAYGPAGDLVLLAVSGRTEANDPAMQDFVRFLADQAARR